MDFFDLSGSATELQSPEAVFPMVDSVSGEFSFSVILDFSLPSDGRVIPSGDNRRLVALSLRARLEAHAESYPIILQNDLGNPPVSNIVVVEGRSFSPTLESGAVDVTALTPPQVIFVRGDTTVSDGIDITDAVVVLDWLQAETDELPCADAADDDGAMTSADSTAILGYVFGTASSLPPPFPEPGEDPSVDDLDCAHPAPTP